MILELFVFLFAALIGKMILGAAAVWLLLPGDGRCPACDGDTMPLVPPRAFSPGYALLRIQPRWCPRCGDDHLARRRKGMRVLVRPERDASPAPSR